jgi:hypothetical protein
MERGYIDLSTMHAQAKIPLNNIQTPKQQRTRMKNREGTNGRGRIKERSYEGEYG